MSKPSAMLRNPRMAEKNAFLYSNGLLFRSGRDVSCSRSLASTLARRTRCARSSKTVARASSRTLFSTGLERALQGETTLQQVVYHVEPPNPQLEELL